MDFGSGDKIAAGLVLAASPWRLSVRVDNFVAQRSFPAVRKTDSKAEPTENVRSIQGFASRWLPGGAQIHPF